MNDPGLRLGGLEARAGRCLERHFYPTLLACILAMSTLAAALGVRPILFRSSASRAEIFHDVELYREYADRMAAGEVPYRDFAVEYPPLGLAVFAASRLFASSPEGYELALMLEMLAFNAAAFVLAARWTARRQGIGRVPRCLAWYAAFFALSLPTSMARYDLAATFAGFATACLLLSGRPRAGGLMAAASVLLKIFPGAAAAPAFFREVVRWRTARPRAIIAASLAFAAGMAAWALVGRGGVLATFRYHSERGLEVGSVYAGLLMLASKVGGGGLSTAFNHFAMHLETPAALRLASLATWVQLAALALALGAYWRSGMRDGLRYATACLLAFIAFGKVLSPQYLIWPIPFFACLEGRPGGRARLAFLATSALTLLVFPLGFQYVASLSGWGIVLLNARNLALVATYGLLVFDRQAIIGATSPDLDAMASRDRKSLEVR